MAGLVVRRIYAWAVAIRDSDTPDRGCDNENASAFAVWLATLAAPMGLGARTMGPWPMVGPQAMGLSPLAALVVVEQIR